MATIDKKKRNDGTLADLGQGIGAGVRAAGALLSAPTVAQGVLQGQVGAAADSFGSGFSAGLTGREPAPASAAPSAPSPLIIDPGNPRSLNIAPPSAGASPASSPASPGPSAGAATPAGGAAAPSPGSYMGSFADAKPSTVIGQFNGRDITKQQAVELDQRLPTSAAGWPVIAGPNGGVAFTPSTKVGPAAQGGAAPANPSGPLATPVASVPASAPAPATPAAATPTTAGNAAPGPLAAPAPTFAANLPGQGGGLGGGAGGGGGGLGGSPPQVDTRGMREAEAERAEARALLERQRGLMELRSQGMNSRGKRQLYAELTGQSMDLTKQRGQLAAADVAGQRQAATAAAAQAGETQRNTANNAQAREIANLQQAGANQRAGIRPPEYRETAGGGLVQVTDGVASPVTDAGGQPIRVPQRPESGGITPAVVLDSLTKQLAAESSALNPNPERIASLQQQIGDLMAGNSGAAQAPSGYTLAGTTPDGKRVYRDANGNTFSE